MLLSPKFNVHLECDLASAGTIRKRLHRIRVRPHEKRRRTDAQGDGYIVTKADWRDVGHTRAGKGSGGIVP